MTDDFKAGLNLAIRVLEQAHREQNDCPEEGLRRKLPGHWIHGVMGRLMYIRDGKRPIDTDAPILFVGPAACADAPIAVE